MCLCERERNDEYATKPKSSARCFDRSMMHFDQSTRERKTDPQSATARLSAMPWDLSEQLEYPLQVFLRNAVTGIADAHYGVSSVFGVARDGDTAARFAVLVRIAQQIRDHLR